MNREKEIICFGGQVGIFRDLAQTSPKLNARGRQAPPPEGAAKGDNGRSRYFAADKGAASGIEVAKTHHRLASALMESQRQEASAERH